MSHVFLTSTALRKSLILRFAIAMALVFATTMGSFFAVHRQLHKSNHDGHLINISGCQRMLSQRIALLATDLSRASDTATRQSLRDELQNAIETMSDAHEKLFESTSIDREAESQAQLQLAFTKSGSLNEQVSHFLELARQIHRQPPNAKSDNLQQLVSISTGGELLAELDALAQLLEEDYEHKQANFARIIFLLASISILVLLVITFAVFRPTVKLVSDNLHYLEASNNELTEFAYRISHDLRSPVVAALGITEMAKESLEDGDIESAFFSIENVLKSLNRVSITIEDIVSLIKQKLSHAIPEKFLLAELIDESLETARQMPDFPQVKLAVNCPDDQQIRAKRVYLKQSIENLVTNAIKYRDRDAAQSTISLDVRIAGSECCVSIADNGLGIDEAYREKMFAMFQRFHPNVSIGTGLGLYLVSQNAAALGGKITYKPLDKGSQFDLSFPILGA